MAEEASGGGGGAPAGGWPGDHVPAGALSHPPGGAGAPSQESHGDHHADSSGGGVPANLQPHRPPGHEQPATVPLVVSYTVTVNLSESQSDQYFQLA